MLKAQDSATNLQTRPISLDEAIHMALAQNLTLQLGQTTPQLARFALGGAYGYYDPVFAGRAGQSFNNRPGRLDSSTGLQFPGTESWVEDFGFGLTGVLPTGTKYELASSLDRSSGSHSDRLITGMFTNINNPFQYSSEAHLGVTQPLLRNFWTDNGRTTIKVRKKELKMAELDLKFSVMDIVNQVAAAYYDLVNTREQVKVREVALQLKEQLQAENKQKVKVGTMAPLDEKQAESEAATARSDLTTARFAAEQAENVLKSLVSSAFVTLHSTVLEPSEKLVAVSQALSLAESWRNGMELRPDYLRLKEDLERQNIILKFTVNQLYPELDLSATYGRNGLGATTK
ncbi:MAG TPA: TolC family protein, partial [Candidatus Binatia bacterium]|nr:TolC family protein [Candidatus Binatia bacterium]